MWIEQYFDVLKNKLDTVKHEEESAIAAGAKIIAEALARGGMIYLFGCGHSAALTMDVFYRAGGLVPIQPILVERVLLNWRPVTETTDWERKEDWAADALTDSGAKPGDVLIVVSTSGRNGAPIDMAIAGKKTGLKVIALTSIEYAKSLPSRHSSGLYLHEATDLVLDNHVDAGDAALSLPALDQRVGPLSTAIGSAMLQAIMVEAAAILLAQGVKPPVFLSSNIPGGEEHNLELLSQYRERIRYL